MNQLKLIKAWTLSHSYFTTEGNMSFFKRSFYELNKH